MLSLRPNRSRFIGLATGMLLTLPLFSTRAMASQGYASKVLHSFADGTTDNDGQPNFNGLIKAPNGSFYGVTTNGGSAGAGTLFSIGPDDTYSILHQFGDGSVANDGTLPQGSLVVGTDGNLYGTTIFGGGSGVGIAFKIAPNGTNYTILHTFDDGSTPHDGLTPRSGMILGSDGNFYGTTSTGGTIGGGIVYQMTPSGTVTILHNFGSVANDGSVSVSPPIQGADGALYGSTVVGGSTNHGMLYKLQTDGSGYTILHQFSDGSVANDGSQPNVSPIFGSDGNLYGTTGFGGAAGTMYRIATDGSGYAIVHNFAGGSTPNDGRNPYAGLSRDTSGNLYGATNGGGTAGQGTIFRYSLAGSYSILYSFLGTDGANPDTAVFLNSDNKIYGIADSGGAASHGTVFRVFPANLVISTPSVATAGSAFNETVTAVDDSNALITDYSGTIHFTSDDPNAALPADTLITNGTGSFQSTLYAAANKTIRVRDTAHSYLTNTSTVAVNSAALDHLSLTTPNSATAGTTFYSTLSALDVYNNVVKSFTDTIHLSSTDTTAVLPANFVLTGGAKQLIVKLNTPGTQTITATDTNAPSFNVTSGSINVGTVATKYLITGPATSTVGAVSTYTITAKDNVGNTVTGYTGTVHFTTTDPNATVPANTMLTNGTGTFQVTFQTKGAQKVNATDTVNAAVKGLASTTVK